MKILKIISISLLLMGSLMDVSYANNTFDFEIKNTVGMGIEDEMKKNFSQIMTMTKLEDGVLIIGNPTLDSGIYSINDVILMRYDNNSNLKWSKVLKSNGRTYFYEAVEMSNGDLVLVGKIASSDLGFENKGKEDAVICRFNKYGELKWKKSFGGSGADYFSNVAECKNGDIVVLGNTDSVDEGISNRGKRDVVLKKYNANGDEIWTSYFGGNGDDIMSSLIIDNNKIIMAGQSYSTNAGFQNKGRVDALILEYDLDGSLLNTNSYGTTSGDIFYEIIKTKYNNYITVGSEGDNAVISKLNENMIVIDKYELYEDGYEYYFEDIIESSDGNLIVIGYKANYDWDNVSAFMMKYDMNGNRIWTRENATNDDEEYLRGVIQLNNDTVLSYGSSYSYNTGKNSSLILKAELDFVEADILVAKAEIEKTVDSVDIARTSVNSLYECENKSILQNRLDNVVQHETLERKTTTANLDLYIKSENILLMSLDTNSVTFDDFSGVEDLEKTNAVNITVSSSLPYQLSAYLPTEIQNADKTNTMDKSILNIKENSESIYQVFSNTTDKVVLKDNCSAGNDLVHGIDIKLKGGIAHEKDVYKTTIKFEAEQK